MFSVVIVEDEKPILDLMKYIIAQNSHFIILGSFTDPLEALAYLPELRPDVVFLDVEMPRMNGLELGQRVNELSEHTKIIFTTAYKGYAFEAFHVQAFDYILKPVTKDAIERMAERLLKQHRLVIPTEQQVRRASIRCFGQFETRNPAGNPVHWPTRKTEELFAYLLCHPGIEISKWYLADLLWPDMDEVRASHNLHNTMYRLKKLLKEQEIHMEVQKVNEGYLLDISNLVYDVLEFEQYHQSMSKGERDMVQEEHLSSIYKGPLFEHKDYHWKVALEERFSKQCTVLVRGLVQQDSTAQEWSKAEQRLEQYLRVYPMNEEMNLLLLQIYESCGSTEKIVKHYTWFEAVYRLEMGLELSQEMRSCVQAYLI